MADSEKGQLAQPGPEGGQKLFSKEAQDEKAETLPVPPHREDHGQLSNAANLLPGEDLTIVVQILKGAGQAEERVALLSIRGGDLPPLFVQALHGEEITNLLALAPFAGLLEALKQALPALLVTVKSKDTGHKSKQAANPANSLQPSMLTGSGLEEQGQDTQGEPAQKEASPAGSSPATTTATAAGAPARVTQLTLF